MAKITYVNKETINPQPSVADKNKVTSNDMNEIKSVVNENNDNIGALSNLNTTDKSSIVNAINEIAQGTSIQVLNQISSSTTDTYSANFVNGLLSNLVNFSKGTLTNNTNVLQYNASYYIELGNLVFLIISDVQFKTAITDTTTIMSGAPAPASDVAFLMTKVDGTTARLHVGTDGNVKDWYSNIGADTSGFGYWYGFVAYIKA